MAKSNKLKKEVLSWIVMIGIFGFLYITGLYVPIAANLQRLVVATGIIKPDTSLDKEEKIVVDYNFKLVDAEGRTVNFKSFEGKVVFLNFWATWCPPCIAEMPDINNLYKQLDEDEIAFVMISSDNDFEKAKSFVAEKNFDFPIYQLRSPLPEALMTNSIPTTFVLSKIGKIEAKKKGFASYDNASFKIFVNDLINRNENL